jgi:phosphomannomutase
MSSAPTPIATHSGLRGRPGKELLDEVIASTLERFAAALRGRGVAPSIALGRDGRPGGRRLASLAADATTAAGLDVVDLGVVCTPAAKVSARALGTGGAVIVTGSHLGPEWNGFKLVAGPEYRPLDIRELPDAERAPVGSPGQVRRDREAARRHADAVYAAVEVDLVRRAGLRVVCHGGAGESAAAVLEGLGCRPADGRPDAVLCLDADGDRLTLADESGRDLDAECTFLLVARARRPGAVVAGADTSRALEAMVDGTVHRVAPGELHLLEGLEAHGADLAGEGNGGVIVPEAALARDGLAAAAVILELLAASGRPLSELTAELPQLARARSTVACTPEDAAGFLSALAERWGVDPARELEEGLLVERAGAWGLVRRSATEPVLRVTAEGPDERTAAALHDDLVDSLRVVPAAR